MAYGFNVKNGTNKIIIDQDATVLGLHSIVNPATTATGDISYAFPTNAFPFIRFPTGRDIYYKSMGLTSNSALYKTDLVSSTIEIALAKPFSNLTGFDSHGIAVFRADGSTVYRSGKSVVSIKDYIRSSFPASRSETSPLLFTISSQATHVFFRVTGFRSWQVYGAGTSSLIKTTYLSRSSSTQVSVGIATIASNGPPYNAGPSAVSFELITARIV